jgi:hypothetical protein
MASALFPDGRAPAAGKFHTLAELRTWVQQAVGLIPEWKDAVVALMITTRSVGNEWG